MIPLDVIKESSFYKAILQEGREEGREVLLELFRDFALKRFPDLKLGEELNKVRDLASLKQLCLELDHFPDEASLRAHLAELAVK